MTQNKKFKRLVRARAARTGESYATAHRHLRAPETEEPSVNEDETPEAEAETFHCSFCGKAQKEVEKLIAGPGGIFICNECVELCAEIIEEDPRAPKPSADEVAKAWSAMLESKAEAARAADEGLTKLVGQARAKGMTWSEVASSLGISAEEAESRYARS